MKRLFAFLLTVLVFVGCNTKPQQTTTEPDSNILAPAVPMPTPEILAALGPENDLPIHRLLPNPLFVAVGKPKRFLSSPISAGNELFVANTVKENFQIF